MVVNKNALLMRDGDGKLVPVEEHSDLFGGTVKIRPLMQGDFAELQNVTGENKDGIMILKHLIDPVLTEEEVKQMPNLAKREVVKLILMSSGMTRKEVDMALEKGIALMQERLEKK